MKRRSRSWVGLFLIAAATLLLIPSRAGSPNVPEEKGITPGSPAASSSQMDGAAKARLVSSYGKLPLSFEPNLGQTDQQVKFLTRGRGYELFLTGDEAFLVLRSASERLSKTETRKGLKASPGSQTAKSAVLCMKLVGAGQRPKVTGLDELPGKSNYFIGRNSKKWHTNIPNYAKVRYQNIYAGIDLVYYGNRGQLEYDFVVAPGSDPKAITLEFTGADGNTPGSLAENGDLVIKAGGSEVCLHKPVVYQVVDSGSAVWNRKSIDGHFVLLAKNRVGVEVATYDKARPLYIDPVISYSTYLGGSSYESANAIAVDAAGSAYIAGETSSPDFPGWAGSVNGGYPPSNAFVTKLSADGSSLVYSTTLGGTTLGDTGGWDVATGIGVDSAGNAYVTGQTYAKDFPTVNAFQDHLAEGICDPDGCADAFVAKLNSAGSMVLYSTYLGGDDVDRATSIASDGSGNAHVTGSTRSANFPMVNPVQATFHPGTCASDGSNFTCPDAFVATINASAIGAASLVHSTYLGGSGTDEAYSIAVDGDGNVYVTGATSSKDFSTTSGAFQTTLAGPADAFVTKINAAGSALVYSTFLGGTDVNADAGISVAVDALGNAYVAGATSSTDFPTTAGAYDTACGTDGLCNGSGDGFVAKLNADGSKLTYSTYLGGSGADIPTGIAVDSMGIVYLTGYTTSIDFPFSKDVSWSYHAPTDWADAFVTKLSAGGEAVIFSTYLGGYWDDVGNGIALDSSRDAYIAGVTGSTDFPVTSEAFQTTSLGGFDGFVMKLSGLALPAVFQSAQSLNFSNQAVGTISPVQTVTLENVGDAATPALSFNITGDFQFTQTCGTTIPSQTSCTMDVTFTPQASGTRTGEVKKYNEATGEWETFLSLSGVGGLSTLGVSSSSLSFADQLVGTTSKAQTVTLTNSGNAAVNFSGIQAATNFTHTTSCGNSLAAGGSCTINVAFAPQSTGSMTEQITINHDAPGSPQAIVLNGKGTDFSVVQRSDPTVTVTAGGKANYNLSVTPTEFSGSIAMGCQWTNGQPRGTSCTVSPASVALDGTNAASVTVSVTTTARSMAPLLQEPRPPGQGGYPVSHLAIWLLGLAAVASLAMRRRRVTMTLASALFLVVLWTACGGGSSPVTPAPVSGTPVGTYSLSVSGTASGVTKSTTLTLVVK